MNLFVAGLSLLFLVFVTLPLTVIIIGTLWETNETLGMIATGLLLWGICSIVGAAVRQYQYHK